MRNKGFSILECMIVISITMLLLLLTVPNLKLMSYTHATRNATYHLQLILQYARSLAVAEQHSVTLCPNVNNHCGNYWNENVLIIGKNFKKSFNLDLQDVTLTLQQSGNTNNHILITPTGMLYVNGHFNFKNLAHPTWPEFKLFFNKGLRTYIIKTL